MPRPDITSWAGPLFKRQLTAALEYLDGSGGGSVPTGTGGVLDMGDRMDAGASYDGGARV